MVANLSRFVQFVELDLSRFAGRQPVEMFGHTQFPRITAAPYVLTLAPHAFFWFALEAQPVEAIAAELQPGEPARLAVHPEAPEWVRGRVRRSFETILVRELPKRRWFDGQARAIQAVRIVDTIPLKKEVLHGTPRLLVLRVEYMEGESEMYVLPLGSVWGEEAERLTAASPHTVLAPMYNPATKEAGVLFDASQDRATAIAILELMMRRRRLKGLHGELSGWTRSEVLEAATPLVETMTVGPPRGEGSRNSIVYSDSWILKLLRRIEPGISPSVEIGTFLDGEEPRFGHIPSVQGVLEYRPAEGEPLVAGILHAYIPNTITAWQFALDSLGRFFEHLMAQPIEARPVPEQPAGRSLLTLAAGDAPSTAKDLLGAFLESAALLGRRTGEMHLALASETKDPAFAPEPFNQFYQRSCYQSARKLAFQARVQLRRNLSSLPGDAQELALELLGREKQVLEKFRALVGVKVVARRIRIHGNYHLGHVLYTGKDFVIINFDGEPELSLSARRIKRSPLEDVAGMVRSIHYATSEALYHLAKIGVLAADAVAAWRQAADFWHQWSSSAFLRAYLTTMAGSQILPACRTISTCCYSFICWSGPSAN